MGKAQVARKIIDLMDDVDLGDFAPAITRDHGEVVDASKHYLRNPKRSLFPGIYKEPRQLAEEANERFEPEGPELRQLFGVSRSDLADMADRKGDAEVDLKYGPREGLKVKATDSVMTQENADRLLMALDEAQDGAPGLWRGMKGWYQMDPAAELLQSWYGKEEGLRLYNRFNDLTAMASPGSEVKTELQRGSAANMMDKMGRFDEFKRLGGMAEDKRTKKFPKELSSVIGHPYHTTAHAGPMSKFVEGGDIDMQSAKVPLYAGAARLQGHGKQTTQPVADAHFARAIGFSDVVGDNTNPGRSMKREEYRKVPQWFREKVSGELGIEAVPAQAILWGLFSPQTGVTSTIGAPKLELLAKGVMEASKRTGRDPKEMLKAILSGDAHAYAGGGVVARKLIDGTFYSALAEALPQLQKKQTKGQALAQLKKLGVSDYELEAENLGGYFDDPDIPFDADKLAEVRRPVSVSTTELSQDAVDKAGESPAYLRALREAEDGIISRRMEDYEPNGGFVDEFDDDGVTKYEINGETYDSFDEAEQARWDAEEADTAYMAGVVRDEIGGADLREELEYRSDWSDLDPENFAPQFDHSYKTKGGKGYAEQLIKLNGGRDLEAGADHDNHWTDHGTGHNRVLSSVREQTFPGLDGKRVKLADEVQSDWGQAWRDAGGGADEEKLRKLKVARYEAQAAYHASRAEYTQLVKAHSDGEAGNDMLADADRKRLELRAEYQRLDTELDAELAKNSGLPDRAPFIDNTSRWTDLALKKSISNAAKETSDFFAWPKGEDVADRYNMRKVIDSIEYRPIGDGKYYVSATDKNGRQFGSGNYPDNELDGVVGKALADKIRAGEGSGLDPIPDTETEKLIKAYGGQERFDRAMAERASKRFISGDGIPFGGEGHVAYYNNILPKRVQEVMRKAGFGKVPVEDVQLVTKQTTKTNPNFNKSAAQLEALKTEGYLPLEATFSQARSMMDEVRSSDPDAFNEIANVLRSVKEEVITQYEGPMAQGIRLTPEMRDKIVKLGFPLFLVAATLGVSEQDLASMMTEEDGSQEFAAGGYVEEMPNDRQVVDDMSTASTPSHMQPEISDAELPSVNVVQMDDGTFGIVDFEGNVMESGLPTAEEAQQLLDAILPQDEPQGFASGGRVGVAKLLARKLGELIMPSEGVYVPPKGKPATFKLPGLADDFDAAPIQEIEDIAKKYSLGRGLDNEIGAYPEFDDERAARIAAEYDKARHDPGNPEVKAHYDEMLDETMDQYKALDELGLDFHFLRDGEADPYAASPALGYKDLVENGRLTVFPTDNGFGTSDLDVSGNPLLKRVGKIGDLDNATANDAFRVVHDVFGHFGPGNPFFRHKGEDRAWMHHSKMFGPRARRAMTSETRGQNSWLNFGPYAEKNRKALGGDTHFADQKTTLLPEWVSDMDDEPQKFAGGGVVGDDQEYSIGGLVSRLVRGNKAFTKARQGAHKMTRDELFDETGFYQGLEGNDEKFLRHEIDDSEARLKDWPSNTKAGMTVADMLEHPELLANYPSLGEIPVNINPERGGAMHRDRSKLEMPTLKELDDGYWTGVFSPGVEKSDRPLSMLLHELQHGIQSIEGFEPGSSPDFASNTVFRTLAKSGDKKAEKVLKDLHRQGMSVDQRYDAYRRHGGEVESRAVQDRMKLNKALRRVEMPLESYDTKLDSILMPETRDFAYNLQPALKVLR